MKANKLFRNNTFLVNVSICLILVLTLCYFGFGSSLKSTYAADCVLNEDGEEVCFGVTNKLQGKYQFVKFFDTSSFSANINFKAGGKSYKSIKYNSSNESLYYDTIDGNSVLVARGGIFSGDWEYQNYDYRDLIIDIEVQQEVTSDFYDWFTSVTIPVSVCYYNSNSDKFIWSNVSFVGVIVNQYTNQVDCNNGVSFILDSNDGFISNNWWGNSETKITSYKTLGAEVTISSLYTSLSRPGYIFKEWNTKYDGTGNSYSSSDSITMKKNIKLYAIWEPITYTLRFDSNGGTGTMEDQTLEYDQGELLTANKFTNPGMVFGGWKYNDVIYLDGQSVSNLTTTNNDVIIFEAVWLAGDQYTVIYNSNHRDDVSNLPASQIKSLDIDLELDSKEPLVDGYQFIGWNTEPNGTGTNYYLGGTYTNNENLVLYAQWVRIFGDDCVYLIDSQSNYIIVSLGENEDEFNRIIELSDDFILGVDTVVVDGIKVLYTGSKFQFAGEVNGNKILKQYNVIVLADLDGNGYVNTKDYTMIYNYITGDLELSDVEFIAADFNADGIVGSQEYVELYNYFVGEE